MRPDSTPTTQFRQLDSGCPGSPSYRSCILLSGRLSVLACMLPEAALTKSGKVGIPCKGLEHPSSISSFIRCHRAKKAAGLVTRRLHPTSKQISPVWLRYPTSKVAASSSRSDRCPERNP
jgi:hypothetical protein